MRTILALPLPCRSWLSRFLASLRSQRLCVKNSREFGKGSPANKNINSMGPRKLAYCHAAAREERRGWKIENRRWIKRHPSSLRSRDPPLGADTGRNTGQVTPRASERELYKWQRHSDFHQMFLKSWRGKSARRASAATSQKVAARQRRTTALPRGRAARIEASLQIKNLKRC